MIPARIADDHTHTTSIRAKNRRAQRRASALQNVKERLEGFAAHLAAKRLTIPIGEAQRQDYDALIDNHAERLLDAMFGLLGLDR